MDQEKIDTIAKSLGVKYKVIDNLKYGKQTYSVSITLTNNSDIPLNHDGKWSIYFCHIRLVEPEILSEQNEVEMKDVGVKFTHVNGCLFNLQPLKSFKTLSKEDSLEIVFKAQYYSIARSDLMPNWYIISDSCEPRVISSTCGEDLSYVEPFDTPSTWKRFDYKLESGTPRYDTYDPFTPEVRYDHNYVEDLKKPGQILLPTPVSLTMHNDDSLDLTTGQWIIATPEDFKQEAEFFIEKLECVKLERKDSASVEKDRPCTVFLNKGEITVKLLTSKSKSPEAYELKVNSTEQQVHIIGNSAAGVFYGIQSLLSILENGKLPCVTIQDCPRYPYRGMHLDVSRNFHKKEEVMKLIEIMAMYKMNKFHFHLTDDEGWRLEIPGLEELTSVGSIRGHDLTEKTCILPMLGSGPDFSTSGSGFYTVSEYKEILAFATRRHIEVIPEIDMPGHSHAAVKAMQARYDRLKKMNDEDGASQYLLSDKDNMELYTSVLMFSENSMNPGVESTYNFVDKVVKEVKAMHADISPLKIFHFGGDEVPYEAWESSPACHELVVSNKVKSTDELMEYFVKRVAKIVAKYGLCLGAWQDGVILDDIKLNPVKRSKFPNKDVFVYAWQNVWESRLAGCSYKLANMGYKVIMAQGTHLYFDHPYEPDPEERGLYWATRYLDTHKTFSFMPDNLYNNADVKLSGEPIKLEQLKLSDDYEHLLESENVIGMQGQLWSELVRTPEALDSMIHPRLAALAERAWHMAPWELQDVESLKISQRADWTRFANTLGYKELMRLDKLGVAYHIPPPGAKVIDGKLKLASSYPGLGLYFKVNDADDWTEFTDCVEVNDGDCIKLQCWSADKKRRSREVSFVYTENSKK